MTNEKKQELDALCLKFRRTLIEILHERQTGHPGGSLSAADIYTYLYFEEYPFQFVNEIWTPEIRGYMTNTVSNTSAGR